MKNFIRKLNLVDWIHYIYYIYLTGLTIFAWSRIPYNALMLGANILYLSFLTILIQTTRPDSCAFLRFVRYFYSLAFIAIIYKQTEVYMMVFHNTWYDPVVTTFEHRLLGVYPTFWLQRIISRPLTEVLRLSYGSYFLGIPAIPLILHHRRDYNSFHRYLFIMMLAFFFCFVGFALFPVQGPRYYWSAFAFDGRQYLFPLLRNSMGLTYEVLRMDGFVFTWLINLLMRGMDSTGACIPSAHAAVATVILYGFIRYTKKLVPLVLPIILGLFAATVYNRYHYVTDLVVGILVGLIAIVIGNLVFRKERVYLKGSAPATAGDNGSR